jgi:hypothetical protein
MPGPVSSRGGRRAGQIGGKILPAVMRKRGGADCSRVQFFLGWWPLLFSGVVGPYLVWGVWFSSRLLLEGTNHIQNFES